MSRLLKIKRPGAPDEANHLCAFCPKALWQSNGDKYICRCLITMEKMDSDGTSGGAPVTDLIECSGYEDAIAEAARNADRDASAFGD